MVDLSMATSTENASSNDDEPYHNKLNEISATFDTEFGNIG